MWRAEAQAASHRHLSAFCLLVSYRHKLLFLMLNTKQSLVAQAPLPNAVKGTGDFFFFCTWLPQLLTVDFVLGQQHYFFMHGLIGKDFKVHVI